MNFLHEKYNIYYELEEVLGVRSQDYTQTAWSPEAEFRTQVELPDFPRLGADLSFENGVSRPQIACLNMVFAAFGIGLISWPTLTLTAISWGLFATFSILILWRIQLVFVGICLRVARRPLSAQTVQDKALPIYSILVPVYQEAGLMSQIAAALSRLNYPAHRLDIQILLESDDTETIIAARDANFSRSVRLTLVAPGGPRTKPNALNVGLSEARGRYLTIYDAEDFPHPNQLRAAHQAFQAAPADIVCLQAPLVGSYKPGRWISAQWALEYAVQFGLLLPGAALYRMPLLIGGTSNHFRKDALQALGGWDAWNVTEDADLGMRIARAGLSCGVISLPTSEDPPTRLRVWLAQRSRWIKGFMQTWLVLMRSPMKTLKQMGVVPFLAMQFSLGGAILTPIFHLPCAQVLVIAVLSEQFALGAFGTGLVSVALFVGLCGDLAAPGKQLPERWLATLTRPFYWPLHSLAAYRAIWELANAPFFWAKTPHTPREMKDTTPCSTGSSASPCLQDL